MSGEMPSSTEAVTVFVRLLDEGTDVWRPARADRLPGDSYRLHFPDNYNPEDEKWEFAPGSTVVCELKAEGGQEVLVATRQGQGDQVCRGGQETVVVLKMDEWARKLETLREAFCGRRARLFLYTVTHNTAVVDVNGPEGKRIFIVLSGCTAIRMPSSWQFEVPRIQGIEGQHGLYQLVDEDAGVEVEFEHLDLRDEYPPVGKLL